MLSPARWNDSLFNWTFFPSTWSDSDTFRSRGASLSSRYVEHSHSHCSFRSKAFLVSHNFTFLFYWRVRRLKKTRRPSCNRVLDFCEKLLPTTWLISAALARRGKRRSDQGPSEERCLLWSTTAQQFTSLGLSSQCWLFWFTVEKNNSYLRYEKYWSKLDSLPTWCFGVNMCPLIYFLFTIFSPCYGRACHIRIKEKKLFHVQKYYSPRAFLVSI